MSYQPRNSGLLTGAGVRRGRVRRSVVYGNKLEHMPDVHITDAWRIKREVWDFDPEWEFEYSQRELLLMAEKILLEDPKPPDETPAWLPAGTYMERLKREVYTGDGMPDPSYVGGMYWRTHPQGRRVSHRYGDSFYR